MRGDLCSEAGMDGLGSWCYGSNHPHAMKGVITTGEARNASSM